MNKKIILILTLVLLGLSVLWLPAEAADGKTTISFSLVNSEQSYMVGDTIKVNVNLSNNPGNLSKVAISISYDKEVLEYAGIDFSGGIFKNWGTKMWNETPQQILLQTNSTSQRSSKDGLVCTLSFKALQETGGTRITPSDISMNSSSMNMTNYRYSKNDITIPIAAYTPSAVPVSGITLNKDSLMLVEEQSATLTAAVTPDDATDKTVTWSSNNTSVATVDKNGKVTAVQAGTTSITARAGNQTAQCNVSVQSADTENIKSGYIVDLSTPETNVAPGVNVPVTVTTDAGSEDKNSLSYYNAIDMTISYDAAKLIFQGIDNTKDWRVVDSSAEGTVRLQKYGSNTALGEAVLLNFQTAGNANGDANIEITSAYLDQRENAALDDAPPASMRNRIITLHIGSESAVYTVKLPSGYEAGNATSATPNNDYVFSITKDSHYDYAVTATIGGQSFALSDPTGKGQYIIEKSKITGDITIAVTKTPKSYTVTKLGNASADITLTGGSTVSYGKDYTFTVTHTNGYDYTTPVIVAGGTRVTGVNPTTSGNVYTYTIPGAKVTGAVSISVTKTENSGNGNNNGNNNSNNNTGGNGNSGSSTTNKNNGSGSSSGGGSTYSGTRTSGQQTGVTPTSSANTLNVVTITGSGKDLIDGPSTIANGSDYTFTFKGDPGEYVISAAIDGEEVDVINNGDGTYTIKSVNGNLEIRVEPIARETAVSNAELNIYRYLKLDGKDMYLITLKGTVESGKMFVYNTNPMYYSDKYGAYCYLVISDLGQNEMLKEAKKAVSTETGTAPSVSYDGDVNKSRRADKNDMELILHMYNAKFDSFSEDATMLEFLSADLSSEGTSEKCLDVSDVRAVTAPEEYQPVELTVTKTQNTETE